MPSAHHATLHRYYTAVWQHGNVAALDDLLTADYIDHDPHAGFGAGRALRRGHPEPPARPRLLRLRGNRICEVWHCEAKADGAR